VVGIAACAHKMEGTRAALTVGLFDVLVVDSDLALALIAQR
jgi:DNA-binding transcriptional regulator LsrR (DeoR family)